MFIASTALRPDPFLWAPERKIKLRPQKRKGRRPTPDRRDPRPSPGGPAVTTLPSGWHLSIKGTEGALPGQVGVKQPSTTSTIWQRRGTP